MFAAVSVAASPKELYAHIISVRGGRPQRRAALQGMFFLVGGTVLDGKLSMIAVLLLPCLVSPMTCWALYPVALARGCDAYPWAAHPGCFGLVLAWVTRNLAQHDLLLGKIWVQILRVWNKQQMVLHVFLCPGPVVLMLAGCSCFPV